MLRLSSGYVHPKLCVKAQFPRQWKSLSGEVNKDFVARFTGEYGEAFVALVRLFWQPHPSNIDTFPLKRKELHESHHVSLCAPLLVTSILFRLLHVSCSVA